MKKVKMTLKIDPLVRKKIDALNLQALMDGSREPYSVIVEKSISDYFEKHATLYAQDYVSDPSKKPLIS